MAFRKPFFDYSSEAFYFITIVTRKRGFFFGSIDNKKVSLSEIGIIADKYWLNIPYHFKNTRLWEYVIMPDHVHGIIQIISQNPFDIKQKPINFNFNKFCSKKILTEFGPLKSNSIPSIINQYKSSVTRWCNKNQKGFFAWQPRYYDHIIRNEKELFLIRRYIRNNPQNWDK